MNTKRLMLRMLLTGRIERHFHVLMCVCGEFECEIRCEL